MCHLLDGCGHLAHSDRARAALRLPAASVCCRHDHQRFRRCHGAHHQRHKGHCCCAGSQDPRVGSQLRRLGGCYNRASPCRGERHPGIHSAAHCADAPQAGHQGDCARSRSQQELSIVVCLRPR
eukprot:Amastigsp_a677190_384.p3 type:complete len:124 gc:universal Amastigsp_a677190_384:546-917(+)